MALFTPMPADFPTEGSEAATASEVPLGHSYLPTHSGYTNYTCRSAAHPTSWVTQPNPPSTYLLTYHPASRLTAPR